MSPQIAHFLLSLLKLSGFVLLVDASLYFLLRAFERVSPKAAFAVSALGFLGVLVYHWMLFAYVVPIVLVGSLLLGAVTVPFHRKSGASSVNAAGALVLLAFVIAVSGAIDAYAVRSYFLSLPFPSASVPPFLYDALVLLFLTLPVFLCPFLLWVFQTWRMRPGLDRDFEEGETRS